MTDAEKLDYLVAAVNELLRRVGGVAPQQATGSDYPDPVAGEGFIAYVQRLAQLVGGEKGEQALRSAGGAFGGMAQSLVDKHNGNWKAAALEYIHGLPPVVPVPTTPEVFAGRWQADSLTDAEAAMVYLYTHTQPGSALAGRVYWQSGLIGGTRDAINRLVNRGERASHGRRFIDFPESELKTALLQIGKYG